MESCGVIRIRGARQHNLRNLSLEFPREKLIVMTGPSGSGKSSLAFHTLFAEGQRRFVESLSAYARQFLDQLEKPDVDAIDGLTYHKPESGMFVMIDVRAYEKDDKVFARKFLDAERVSVLPGVAFGNCTRGHVRFSLVQPLGVLMDGCDRLQQFVNTL